MNRYAAVIRETIAVPTTPARSVILPVQRVAFASKVMIEAQNPDIAQTLNMFLEKSSDINGPWTTSTYDGLQNILAGESRLEVLEVDSVDFFRVTASASGAGIAGIFSATLYGDSN